MPNTAVIDVATTKLLNKLDSNLLRPQYVTQTIILDSKYVTYTNNQYTTEIIFTLGLNSTNPNDIKLSQPLKGIIKAELAQFVLPQFYYDISLPSLLSVAVIPPKHVLPAERLLYIRIKEFVENLATYDSTKQAFVGRAELSNADLKSGNTCTIVPSESLNFRFPLQSITTITLSMSDTTGAIRFMNPTYTLSNPVTAAIIYMGFPTVITYSNTPVYNETQFNGDEHVFITDCNTGVMGFDLLINSPTGHRAVSNITNYNAEMTATQSISIYMDTTSFMASYPFGLTYSGSMKFYIPSRRLQIPITLYQLRPEFDALY